MTSAGTRDAAPLETELSAAAFRAAMGRFPTGVTLLTQGPPQSLEVMTANSFVSVSLDPLLVLVCVRFTGRMRARMDAGESYAIQVLGADQHEVAAVFARHDRPHGWEAARYLGAQPSPAGNAIVADAVACFECVPHARHVAGDHVLFIGQVITIRVSQAVRSPLLFHRGKFGSPA